MRDQDRRILRLGGSGRPRARNAREFGQSTCGAVCASSRGMVRHVGAALVAGIVMLTAPFAAAATTGPPIAPPRATAPSTGKGTSVTPSLREVLAQQRQQPAQTRAATRAAAAAPAATRAPRAKAKAKAKADGAPEARRAAAPTKTSSPPRQRAQPPDEPPRAIVEMPRPSVDEPFSFGRFSAKARGSDAVVTYRLKGPGTADAAVRIMNDHPGTEIEPAGLLGHAVQMTHRVTAPTQRDRESKVEALRGYLMELEADSTRAQRR